MEIFISEQTDVDELIGGTFRDEHGDSLTILSADHAPKLNALAYGARSQAAGGYLFAALLPYGKALVR